MPHPEYDVIVIGTGAGGGMAIKTLCEAGLKVCALNAGRRLNPQKDFRNHRMPWEMKFRGFAIPGNRPITIPGSWIPSGGRTSGNAKSHSRRRPGARGCGRGVLPWGEDELLGKSSARFGAVDFRAASLDGYDRTGR